MRKSADSRLRRVLRLVVDASSSISPETDIPALAREISQRELVVEGVFRRILGMHGEALERFAASPICTQAVARRLLLHLDEKAGEISIDRFAELSTAAVMIARRTVNAALRVRAWQKQGTAIARKGLYRDAERSFALAEQAVSSTLAPHYYGAVVTLARAVAQYSRERLDRSAALLEGLAPVFEEYADTTRARYTRDLHASILFYFGDPAQALVEYEAITEMIVENGTRYERAVHVANKANCYLALGDELTARELFDEALPTLTALGQLDVVARAERQFSDRAIARGDLSAVSRLGDVAQKFLGAGCIGEYIHTMLDVLEHRVLTEPAAKIEALCSELMTQAIACGIEQEVTTRLAMITALAARNELTLEAITNVRRVVDVERMVVVN